MKVTMKIKGRGMRLSQSSAFRLWSASI